MEGKVSSKAALYTITNVQKTSINYMQRWVFATIIFVLIYYLNEHRLYTPEEVNIKLSNGSYHFRHNEEYQRKKIDAHFSEILNYRYFKEKVSMKCKNGHTRFLEK